LWSKILENLIVYGPLGIVFYIYIQENFKRQESILKAQSEKDTKNQDNYQLLLDTIIKSSNDNISKLEVTIDKLSTNIEKANKFYDMALGDISDSISKMKEECGRNCSNVLLSIKDEKVLSDKLFMIIVEDKIKEKSLQAIVDISTNIDENGFYQKENVIFLKNNIIRILEKRRNEALEDICKQRYEGLKKQQFLEQGEYIYNQYLERMKNEVILQITQESLASDNNYKRLKSSIKNIIFSYSEDICKTLNNIFFDK